jgi:hypothetical protein
MSDTDATSSITIPTGMTDTTVSFSVYVDPIVDAYFRHCGRMSRRRFENIIRMRYKKLLQSCNLDPMWIAEALRKFKTSNVKSYVREQIEPGYRIQFPERDNG